MTSAAAPVVLELDESTVTAYLRAHTDLLDPTTPVDVRAVAGGPDSPEEEGFVNFVFRVRQGDRSWIVKQSRHYLRTFELGHRLEPERNFQEYLAFVLRAGIDESTVPRMHFVDEVNNVFVMEDLYRSDLRPLRYQLNEGVEFPNFAGQVAAFLASNHFFTSELFLEKETFRHLQQDFANLSMRAVMEDVVLTRLAVEPDGSALDHLGRSAWQDPRLRLELVKARDVLVRKGECLIHGDLHTSNLLVDADNLRVIDMEYAFVGPFSYDLGYLLANFVSQYAAFEVNTRFDQARRRGFQRYLLGTIRDVLEGYFERFSRHFAENAKPIYRETAGYLEDYLFPGVLQETIGFMAAANLHRIANLAPFPDFDSIADDTERLLAQGLSVAIDEHLLRNHAGLTTPELLVQGITAARDAYRRTVIRRRS
ncbi:MAG: phosphotransferase [Propionicimonas sp.]